MCVAAGVAAGAGVGVGFGIGFVAENTAMQAR